MVDLKPPTSSNSQVGVMRDGPESIYGYLSGSSPALTMQKTMNRVSLPCKRWVLKVQTVRWRNGRRLVL
jgi:hypothetical protein